MEMIQVKCTNDKCGKKFTKDDVATLRDSGSKIDKKCPTCKKKLTWNVTDRYARKRWYGYLSQDKAMVEYLVVVIFDEFDDKRIDVEIPLLALQFTSDNLLTAHKTVNKEIEGFLMNRYKKQFDNDQQFITPAFHEETVSMKNSVSVWW